MAVSVNTEMFLNPSLPLSISLRYGKDVYSKIVCNSEKSGNNRKAN